MKKSEFVFDDVMKSTKTRRVIKMKNFFKKFKLIAVLCAFLGGTGAGMSALMTAPVMAAEPSVERVADAKSGYSLPSEITIKKGEKRIVTLTTPAGNKEYQNIAWSYNPNYVDFSSAEGQGSYRGKQHTLL